METRSVGGSVLYLLLFGVSLLVEILASNRGSVGGALLAFFVAIGCVCRARVLAGGIDGRGG